MITQSLQHKEKKFTVETSAQPDQITGLWDSLLLIDTEFDLQHSDKISQVSHTRIKEFMPHCCRERHYFFRIRNRVTVPSVFQYDCPVMNFRKSSHSLIQYLMMAITSLLMMYMAQKHLKSTDLHCKNVKKEKLLLFYASVHHVRNSGMMLMCDECGMWRLVYTTRKISASEKRLLESALNGLSFSCGSPLQEADLELPEQLLSVGDLQCNDPVEALYYSADYTDVCPLLQQYRDN